MCSSRKSSQKNPFLATPDVIADGKEAFSHYCVACHGMDGQNTGVPFVDHISPPIPSLASAEVQHYTDGQLKWVIDGRQLQLEDVCSEFPVDFVEVLRGSAALDFEPPDSGRDACK